MNKAGLIRRQLIIFLKMILQAFKDNFFKDYALLIKERCRSIIRC